MHNIWLIMILLLSLLPVSQLNAQSELPLAPEETSPQSPKTTINASTTASHEKSPVREMLDELIFNYETVYFETARYSLSPAAKRILKRKANWIKSQDPSKQVVIIGHCDRRGSESKNQYLGALRAHTVKQFLISCGIDKSRVRILSAGERQPLSQVENETGLAKNRRVEVIVR
jgi:peptidoglycan-associated lipoprotein